MNIYQMRHAVLARHIGEPFTPAQLRAEFLQTFPKIKPQSVNASDCHYSDRKRAGSTCPECAKLGGFAVNRNGIVDMGASGWGKLPESYTPTGNHHPPRGTIVTADFQPTGVFRISRNDAIECVQLYNESSYRGIKNTVLDREGYRIFQGGLSVEAKRLADQVAFVGEQYGGAQERFGSIRNEAELIAANLHSMLDRWIKPVKEARPLVERAPDQATLEFLFSPFRGTKQWPVWTSKTLHFVRPDVFPILDSNAKKPLGLRNLPNSGRDYHRFCLIFRQALLANAQSLDAARVADGGESPTDLKLLDKILFQRGLRMG